MRGIGTHPRVGPEGLRISRRVVTAKVRHLVPPPISAPLAAKGLARPAATRLAAPVFRKDRLSMTFTLLFWIANRRRPNGIGRAIGVKSVFTMIVWGAIALPDEPWLATPRGHHVAILSFDAAPLWTEAERMRNHPTISRASSPRWRVALLGETLQARASLAEAIHSVGGTVVLVRVSASETLDDLSRARPDVAIVAPQPLWHGGALLLRLRDHASCPVVLLAQTPSRRLLDEALEAGVMGCLIEPVRAVQLASTLDLAVARFREMQG